MLEKNISVFRLALIIAIPAAVIAGPLFAKWINTRVIPEGEPELIRINQRGKTLPGTGISFFIILLPVILMILSAMAPYMSLPDGLMKFSAFIGSPAIALLITCFAAFYFLGIRQGMDGTVIKKLTEESLLPVGSIILIIGAGGGFKQILIDSGVGDTIGQMSENLSLSPLVLAFMIAGLIRIATGSATVALTTAAGIVSPIIEHMSGVNLELLVIATGAGSLMFSHVNDAGFWMVKEYLGLTVKETFKTWTVLETLLSFIAFAGVLLVNMFI
ncbi:gluconate transporter [Peribacillus cavernae]|nr:gluconate transporter [Peribacillus cavernae]